MCALGGRTRGAGFKPSRERIVCRAEFFAGPAEASVDGWWMEDLDGEGGS